MVDAQERSFTAPYAALDEIGWLLLFFLQVVTFVVAWRDRANPFLIGAIVVVPILGPALYWSSRTWRRAKRPGTKTVDDAARVASEESSQTPMFRS